jgi:SAM-dependent methyltransferase
MTSSPRPRPRRWGSDPATAAVRVDKAESYACLAAVYDEIVVDHCHRLWASYLHELWISDPAGVHSVLDLGCGTGLMAAALTSYGYRVTGVDSSAAMLARARRLVGSEAVLIQGSMPGLRVGGVFDAVISTFDALNYLSPTKFGATVAAVAGRLRPGGWLVFDLHTAAMLDFTIANPVVAGTADGRHFTLSSVVDPAARTCDTRIVVSRATDGDAFAEQHRQYFHTAAQVVDALLDAGFALTTVTEEYSHRPADASTLRATWTARRGAGGAHQVCEGGRNSRRTF